MEDVYHFFGGVGKDLTFKYYWTDDYDEKNINELINAFSKVFKNLDKVEKVKLNEFQ